MYPKTIYNFKKFLLYIIVISTLFSGCRGNQSSGNSSQNDFELTEETVVFEERELRSLDSVSRDGATFQFSEPPTKIKDLKVGDIIVGEPVDPAPDGFLRKVVGVSTTENMTILTTEQASLEEAIVNGHIQISQKLEPGDIESVSFIDGVALLNYHVSSIGVLAAPGKNEHEAPNLKAMTIDIDNALLLDLDGDEDTKFDQFVANGMIRFEPDYDLDIDIKDRRISYAHFILTAEDSVDLRISNYMDDPNLGRQILNIHKKKQIGVIKFRSSTIWVSGFFIVVKPIIYIFVGLDGDLDYGITTGFTQKASFKSGIKYKDGDIKTVKEFTNDFDFHEPTIDGNVNMTFFGGPELFLKLYGAGGPQAGVNGYARIEAGLRRDPCWELFAGFFVTLMFAVDINLFDTIEIQYATDQIEVLRKEKSLLKSLLSCKSLETEEPVRTTEVAIETTEDVIETTEPPVDIPNTEVPVQTTEPPVEIPTTEEPIRTTEPPPDEDLCLWKDEIVGRWELDTDGPIFWSSVFERNGKYQTYCGGVTITCIGHEGQYECLDNGDLKMIWVDGESISKVKIDNDVMEITDRQSNSKQTWKRVDENDQDQGDHSTCLWQENIKGHWAQIISSEDGDTQSYQYIFYDDGTLLQKVLGIDDSWENFNGSYECMPNGRLRMKINGQFIEKIVEGDYYGMTLIDPNNQIPDEIYIKLF